MKKTALILLMAIASLTVHAQVNTTQANANNSYQQEVTTLTNGKNRANYFLGAGGGLGAYIGNEPVSEAKQNPMDYRLYIEAGRWLSPQISLSTQVDLYTVHSQSAYSLNPYINHIEGMRLDKNDIDTYHPYMVRGLSVDLRLGIDLTNIFHDATLGWSRKFHLSAVLGLGVAASFGTQHNEYAVKNSGTEKIGDVKRNWEMNFSGSLLGEYTIDKHWTATMTLCMMGVGERHDYSYYENESGGVDWMPHGMLGVRYNFAQRVKKNAYNPQ